MATRVARQPQTVIDHMEICNDAATLAVDRQRSYKYVGTQFRHTGALEAHIMRVLYHTYQKRRYGAKCTQMDGYILVTVDRSTLGIPKRVRAYLKDLMSGKL